MTANRARFEDSLMTPVPDELVRTIGAVSESCGPLRCAVFMEDWSGDCLNYAPLAIALALEANLDLRIFPRDSFPQLMDRYETQGRRAIPVVLWMDAEGEEMARFVERPRLHTAHKEGKVVAELQGLSQDDLKARFRLAFWEEAQELLGAFKPNG
jgi:hypothetical protein